MKKTFISNPNLPFVSPSKSEGNLFIGGQFTNGQHPDPNLFPLAMKWMMSPNPHKKEKKADPFRVSVVESMQFFNSTADGLVWLGHSSFLMRLHGKVLLTDPVFFSLPFLPRMAALPFPVEQIKGVDYLLLSHGHRDHFDEKSLKIVLANNPKATILCPLNMTHLLKKLCENTIQEAAWYQQYDTEGIKICFLPAQHWHRRGMFDFNQVLWGSFRIETENTSVYFAGDSGYGPHFKEIQTTFPSTDVCLMPIGAFLPRYLMKTSHTSPEEAVQAFHDLNGRVFVPCHYGTFDLADEPLGEPIRRMECIVDEGKLQGRFEAMPIGGLMDL